MTMINENKKLVLLVAIFVLSVLVTEFLYRQPGIIKKDEVVQETSNLVKSSNEETASNEEELFYSGSTPIKGGSIILSKWDSNEKGTAIYIYDFKSGEKRFVDWSLDYSNEFRYSDNKLIYKTGYNQYSIYYFAYGEKEIIDIPEIPEGFTGYPEIMAILFYGNRVFYMFNCNDNSCETFSIREYDRDTGETRIIKKDIKEVLPIGGIQLGFTITEFDEKNNKLYFNFGGGDVCVSFSEGYSVNLKTGKMVLVDSRGDNWCPGETTETPEPTKVEPTKTEREESLRSENTCGDLKIFDYGNNFPMEIYRGNEVKFINNKEYDVFGKKVFVDYDFVGCVKD